MKPRERQGYRHIREIYEMVPEIQCKGLCHNSCTSIDASDLEKKFIQERHGVTFPPPIPAWRLRQMDDSGETLPRCPALGPLNNCRIYDNRPLICRLYGADAAAPCEHGCVPEGGWLTAEIGTAMIETVERISRELLG
jgi:Fe-S-cluster containining protein